MNEWGKLHTLSSVRTDVKVSPNLNMTKSKKGPDLYWSYQVSFTSPEVQSMMILGKKGCVSTLVNVITRHMMSFTSSRMTTTDQS